MVEKNDFTENGNNFSFDYLNEENANSFSAAAQDFYSGINSVCSISMNKGGNKEPVKEIKETIKRIRETIQIESKWVSFVNSVENIQYTKKQSNEKK